jgi:subtilase family serine protease
VPDLVVEKGVEIGPDGKFIVSYTVTNIGDGPAGESTTCKYVDGELQESQTCLALAPDESYSYAFEPEKCPCGAILNVTVCADNDNNVEESDETNNCEVNFVDCPPCKPDLVVGKGVEIGPDGKFIVSYTVTNIGDGPAGESATCKYVDGVLQETQPCPALTPDESHNGAFNAEECPCGTTTMMLTRVTRGTTAR